MSSKVRVYPGDYDEWIVKAVCRIGSRVWDFTQGTVDLASVGDLGEIAEIIRREAPGDVGSSVVAVPSVVPGRVVNIVLMFG